jgi:anti-sigma factor RsiW
MTCADTTRALGVYVLGALDPAERATVEAHLATCADCQAELASLAALPAILDRLTLDDLEMEPLAVPEDLFDRVAARAREEQDRATERSRFTRYRRLSAAAAAVVLIAGVSIGAIAATHHHTGTRPFPSTTTRSAVQGSVHMRVQLAAQTAGTSIQVAVSGLPSDEHCRLIAVAKDGSRDVASRWYATYGGRGQQTGSTTIPRSQLSKLVLLGSSGNELVSVRV